MPPRDKSSFKSWASLTACLLLVGVLVASCGTDIPMMLEEDSKLYWRDVDDLVADDDGDFDEEAVLELVENEKWQACTKVYKAVNERIEREMREGPLPFFDKFVYDFKLFGAFLVPIGFVERCRIAIERYREESIKIDAVASP